MLLNGVEVIWIAAGAGALLLVVVALIILMGSSSSKGKAKALPISASKGAAMPKTPRGTGPTPTPASASPPETASPLFRNVTAGSMPDVALTEVAVRAKRPAPPVTDRIVGDFNAPSAWRSPSGGPLPPGLEKSAYALGPLAGVQSSLSLEVCPGEKFVVEYCVRMLAAPKNGKPSHYVVGPMFLDATDNVLSWGSIEAPLTAAEHSGRIEAEAPPTATRVHLYIGGLWAYEEPHPDGVIAYTKATLQAVKL